MRRDELVPALSEISQFCPGLVVISRLSCTFFDSQDDLEAEILGDVQENLYNSLLVFARMGLTFQEAPIYVQYREKPENAWVTHLNLERNLV